MTKTDPTPTVDLEEVRRFTAERLTQREEIDKDDGMTRYARRAQDYLIKLAEEVERLRKSVSGKWCKKKRHWVATNAADCTSCHLEEKNDQMREALEKIKDLDPVDIGDLDAQEIVRAALPEKP